MGEINLSSHQMEQLNELQIKFSDLVSQIQNVSSESGERSCTTCYGTCEGKCTGCQTCQDTSKAG